MQNFESKMQAHLNWFTYINNFFPMHIMFKNNFGNIRISKHFITYEKSLLQTTLQLLLQSFERKWAKPQQKYIVLKAL